MDSVILMQQWWVELQKANILNSILFSVFLLLSVFYLVTRLITNNEKTNLPPSPPKLPIIGNLHQLGGLAVRSLQSLSNKYGPLMILHFGQVPTLLVSSAEVAQEIMKTHDVAFSDRPQTRATDAIFFGSNNIAFSRYGEYWRQVKKISVMELLSQKRVQELLSVKSEVVENMVEKVRISCISGAEVNLTDMFVTISYDVISRSALGRVFDKAAGVKSFGELSGRAIELLGEFCFKDMFPCFGWLDYISGLVRKLKDASKSLHDFLDEVIDEHQVLNSNDKKDFVNILLHLQKEDRFDINLTRENLKSIIMDMFVGGTDTGATAMEWAMSELIKNPSVLKKAQEEVRRVVGEKSKVSESDVNQMVYLKWILKESLRLHPPALIVRETTQNVKVKGYDIPESTRVLINVWAIQRDPRVWERADEFIPERFAETSVDFKGGHVQFIPFGSGRRICPGLAFAVTEIELVLANLLYWFDWKLPNGQTPQDLDMDEVNNLVIRRKTPLLLVPALHFP